MGGDFLDEYFTTEYTPHFGKRANPFPDLRGKTLTSCQGTKTVGRHGGTVYKCPKCGAAGCNSPGCTGQNFNSNRCMTCGRIGNPDRL